MPPTTPLTADPATHQGSARTVRAGPRRDRPGRPPVLRMWRELLLIAAFYIVYTVVRDLRGTRPVSVAQAYHHAQWIIGLERGLGVFHEAQIQHAFLHHRQIVEILDVWYGSTHFVVTAAVLALLFFRHPSRYRVGRNALALATVLALAGFAFYPLMPPRLLPPSFGFVDTLQSVGGLWAFNSGPMPDLSNQFAAMPSLHFAWALWCGAAVIPVMRRRWSKAAVACYPAITLVSVVATGNHYVLDVAAGALIVAVGFALPWLVGVIGRRAPFGRPPALLRARASGGP